MAVLLKVHHAVADGSASTALLASIMTTDPGHVSQLTPALTIPAPTLSRFTLIKGALRALFADLRRLPLVIRDTRARMARRRVAVATLPDDAGAPPPRPLLDTPVTSLNRAITAQRAVATTSLPLGPMLEAKLAAGVTLNDVLLTMVGGALVDVLAERGEHPTRSLSAGVPVSSEPPLQPGQPSRTSGNKVSNLFVSLCTDVTDPAERLGAVHRATATAKLLHEALGGDLMETWLEYTPPRPYAWLMRRYSSLSVADHHPAPFNVVVSNVAGPRQPLYADGARLVEFFSSGPVLEGIGVNVTAWSYLGHLNVMVNACARALPDPGQLTLGLSRNLEALSEALRRDAAVAEGHGGYQRHARRHARVLHRHSEPDSGSAE